MTGLVAATRSRRASPPLCCLSPRCRLSIEFLVVCFLLGCLLLLCIRLLVASEVCGALESAAGLRVSENALTAALRSFAAHVTHLFRRNRSASLPRLLFAMYHPCQQQHNNNNTDLETSEQPSTAAQWRCLQSGITLVLCLLPLSSPAREISKVKRVTKEHDVGRAVGRRIAGYVLGTTKDVQSRFSILLMKIK